MGKILILSVTDHEEHILNKIMETIANEPKLNHIAPPLPCNILSFKNLEIRLKEQTVSCRDQLVTLTHHEFAVLTYLARHPGWVFSASQIYEAVWDRDGEHCGTAVASVIGQIRRKLTPDTPKGGYIRTVPGSGYKCESVIEETPDICRLALSGASFYIKQGYKYYFLALIERRNYN